VPPRRSREAATPNKKARHEAEHFCLSHRRCRAGKGEKDMPIAQDRARAQDSHLRPQQHLRPHQRPPANSRPGSDRLPLSNKRRDGRDA
jgi:hypothetical protein